MKVVSLFSGAGGLDLGFKMAGHEIIWANDNFPEAVETYRKNLESVCFHYNLVLSCNISSCIRRFSSVRWNVDPLSGCVLRVVA